MMDSKHALRNTQHVAHINVQVTQRYLDKVKPALLRKAARATLEQQGVTSRVELTIVITGNAQLRALNREFRHIDAPTDVLSFATYISLQPEAGSSHGAGQNSARYLGDVIISYPTAKAQATAGGHPIEAELQLLVAHGVLHLLGHDHDTRAKKATMWQAQREVLRHIDAAMVEPTE
jgi:probable rRNA maturation factor